MEPIAAERKLSPNEIAQEWGLNYKTILRLIKRGAVRAYRIGRGLRILESDWQTYLEQRSSTTQGA